ncbi:unnamed protein product [Allacma fusca]|uniref:Uncharacterized protein n=1 Tax=Allacma fusca TaxID=39272 RepID=A0A8J2K375_9HEXA|nr:unnamed protein product [Allacma fusca]
MVLIRFREKKIRVVAGLAKAFLQLRNYFKRDGSNSTGNYLKPKGFSTIVRRHHDEKVQLIKTLQEVPDNLSLILDCCTTKHYIGFQGVIVSWISKDWKYEQVLLVLDILKEKVLAVTSNIIRNCDTNELKFVVPMTNLSNSYQRQLQTRSIVYHGERSMRATAQIWNGWLDISWLFHKQAFLLKGVSLMTRTCCHRNVFLCLVKQSGYAFV